MSNAAESSSSQSTACFSWSRILLSASFPVIFGIFSVVFTIQQNIISQANREQDQRQANILRQQHIYDAYINDISALLISPSFNESNRHQLNYIGFKTVDIIKHLSKAQKRDIIFFLHNHELLSLNKPASQRVDLVGADLTNVEFIRSPSLNCDLRNISLQYILASNIVFDRCDISFALFQGAWMVGANFIKSIMHGANFGKANLTDVVFDGNNINLIVLSNAILINSKFLELKPYQTDFTNTDLLNSDLTDRDLSLLKDRFNNTRLPNGTFIAVDSTQLINDGGAEKACTRGSHREWMKFQQYSNLDLYTANYRNWSTPKSVNGKCYFGKNSLGVMYQYFSKTHYSLLINNEHAYFNLSAYMGCTIPNRGNDRALIDVRCFDQFYNGPVCAHVSIFWI
ncbi:unnamed protein product [Adineta ricciae]|uniref:Pentapeptide repeat-containing protein n=1 Tax=Adineta ricciae TaxID=249248 RepID=A0A816F6W8_ADIRI|nr:unnamed protein product [Adineta ricciae]CAF1658689.1 unnamed protein product [Adineta ricciae]